MEKKPTLRSIAERVGYSKSTVSMALRDDARLAVSTRRTIQRAAADVGYRHNPVVAHLMAQLSRSRKQAYKATLALIHLADGKDALDREGAVRMWVEGCEARAGELGYRLDRFWLGEPGLNQEKLAAIFHARNIAGVLVINSHAWTALPEAYASLWTSHPCIVVGNRIANPPLNYVCNDQYFTTFEAVRKLVGLGYQRPGLVMCEELDNKVEYKFSAGYLKGHALAIGGKALPVIEPSKHDMAVFAAWVKAHRPDVALCINPWPKVWVKQLGVNVDLVSLDREPFMRSWTGMNQNHAMIGSVAVEQLIGQIHRNEPGLAPVATCSLIQSSWEEGNASGERQFEVSGIFNAKSRRVAKVAKEERKRDHGGTQVGVRGGEPRGVGSSEMSPLRST